MRILCLYTLKFKNFFMIFKDISENLKRQIDDDGEKDKIVEEA